MSKRIDILVVGMDKITDKSCYIYDEFQDRGIKTLLYSRDKTGFYSGENKKKYKTEIVVTPKNFLADCWTFLTLVITRRPKQLEFYRPKPLSQVFYAMVCLLLRKKYTILCYGELYAWAEEGGWRQRLDKFMYRNAKLLILTELYMADTIMEYNITDVAKTVFIHNRIPIQKDYSVSREGKKILFINSFKPWRKLEILIKAMPEVLAIHPDATLDLVGSTLTHDYMKMTESYTHDLIKLVDDLKLKDSVTFHEFTSDAKDFMRDAKIFALPADLIFCNYSLIESMQFGVAPIVAGVDEGAKMIVNDGEDGFICDQDHAAFAKQIIALLNDDDLRIKIATKAHQKIADKFNIKTTCDLMINAYKERLGIDYEVKSPSKASA